MKKLRMWIQIVLLIIGGYGVALIAFNPDSIVKIASGIITMVVPVIIVSEYGTIFDIIEHIIRTF